MNPKYEKICADIARLEKRAADIQEQLNTLYDKRTEMENTAIINTVRELVMDREQIMAFLGTLSSPSSNKLQKQEQEVIEIA